ncbi:MULTISPECIES: hypothetical protein [Corynebacterium]|uniref:Membrane protein n=1 Tax=Corynebacterium flavescens TaxID=28028 RepID=A0A1L7CLX9_CORFL|nr:MULTISPECIES: hypothetical protein [Corynebacterium]APT86828.1 membrane protein [Corynebacterium flavescens]MDN6098581.1 hypothetical protein [Corynebacterium flavescens]MDN6198923.1 hypothetical protein [Corynebacterium flavescens]MDN6225614.1 hypothetical protein [Corynebacterium flavescens]MDN6235970.1 hypothetical protein [Corynebacterium flavescens]
MSSRHIIPALWFRLVVLLGFIIFVGFQSMWIVLSVAVALVGLTAWQLLRAYRS